MAATHEIDPKEVYRLVCESEESRRGLTIEEWMECRKGDIQPILDRSFRDMMARGRSLILSFGVYL